MSHPYDNSDLVVVDAELRVKTPSHIAVRLGQTDRVAGEQWAWLPREIVDYDQGLLLLPKWVAIEAGLMP